MKGMRALISVLVVGLAVALAVGPSQAQPPAPQAQAGPLAPLDTSFTYQGQLKKNGATVSGDCAMAFRLYDAAEDGVQVGGALTPTVPVSNSLFTVPLDFGASAFTGDARWLGIQVQCPGDAGYADLGRQPLTAAPYALYALSTPWSGLRDIPPGFADGIDDVTAVVSGTDVLAGDGLTRVSSGDAVTLSVLYAGSGGNYGAATSVARSDHAHWGATWSGSGVGLTLSGGTTGISATGTIRGIYGGGGNYGVIGDGRDMGVRGQSRLDTGTGVFGTAYVGVYGDGASTGVIGDGGDFGVSGYGNFMGVDGQATSGIGVRGIGPITGVVGIATSTASDAFGVYGRTASQCTGAGVYGEASTTELGCPTFGVRGKAASADGYGGYFYNAVGGVALVAYSNAVGDIFTVQNGSGTVFRVNGAGNVHADGGYHCGNGINDGAGDLDEGEIAPCLYDDSPADFAEMLPAARALEPGDVLVIGPDGKLARSTQPYQTSVVGVYSTRPSYLGNGQHASDADYAPLAVVGIVPVKVTTENGAILPGDLLVASSTPGHAMKAGPNPPLGTVIGKALERLDVSQGAGIIRLLVTLQ
jgi:hypothetical protein